jgi:hypothetical protein
MQGQRRKLTGRLPLAPRGPAVLDGPRGRTGAGSPSVGRGEPAEPVLLRSRAQPGSAPVLARQPHPGGEWHGLAGLGTGSPEASGRPRPSWVTPHPPPTPVRVAHQPNPVGGVGESLGNGRRPRRHRRHRKRPWWFLFGREGLPTSSQPTTRRASRFGGAGGAGGSVGSRSFLGRHRRLFFRWRLGGAGGFRWRGRASHSRQRTPLHWVAPPEGGGGRALGGAAPPEAAGAGDRRPAAFAVLASRSARSRACAGACARGPLLRPPGGPGAPPGPPEGRRAGGKARARPSRPSVGPSPGPGGRAGQPASSFLARAPARARPGEPPEAGRRPDGPGRPPRPFARRRVRAKDSPPRHRPAGGTTPGARSRSPPAPAGPTPRPARRPSPGRSPNGEGERQYLRRPPGRAGLTPAGVVPVPPRRLVTSRNRRVRAIVREVRSAEDPSADGQRRSPHRTSFWPGQIGLPMFS